MKYPVVFLKAMERRKNLCAARPENYLSTANHFSAWFSPQSIAKLKLALLSRTCALVDMKNCIKVFSRTYEASVVATLDLNLVDPYIQDLW